jgi:hypothetical protein
MYGIGGMIIDKRSFSKIKVSPREIKLEAPK